MPLSALRAATEHPERIALVVGGRAWSYAELASRVERIVGWLDRRIAREGAARVALVPRLDVETVCTVLALLERGTTAVLLHPRLTPVERATLVADAAPDLVLEDVAGELVEAWLCPPALQRGPPPDEDGCLAILYTSGTTGRPKGAMLSRRAFRASADASAGNLGWRSEERWLLCMPLAHVGGLSILVRSLMARRCVVIPETDKFEPAVIQAVIERDRVTLCSFVPTMLKRLLDDGRALTPHVRAVLLGGAAAPSSLLGVVNDLALPVLTTYGLTEACSQVTTQRYGTPAGVVQGAGHPVSGAEIRIVDDRIELRSPSLMSGYLGHAEDPLLPGGWLRTEDFGSIDAEGRLHVLGRCQELVVTGGENVYPLEVERDLESIPGVGAACVFGAPDETWGEIVCAAVVRDTEGPALALPDLAVAIDARLATHKRPRRIAWVTELPATPVGKLDRAAAVKAALPLLVSFPRTR